MKKINLFHRWSFKSFPKSLWKLIRKILKLTWKGIRHFSGFINRFILAPALEKIGSLFRELRQKFLKAVLKFYQRAGIKIKMILIFTVLTSILILVISIFNWYSQKENIDRMIYRMAKGSIQALEKSLSEYLTLGQPREYQLILQKFARDPMEGLENVQLFDMVNASEMKQAESIQPEIRKISESAFEEFRKTYPLKKHDNAFFLPQEKELLQTIQKKETRNYIYFFSPISFRQVELFNSIAHTRILGFLRFAFNKTELYHPIRATLEKLIQGASYVLIAGIIGILIFSLFITHPITKLQHGVENIRNGNLDFQIHIHSADELGYLGRQFNEMVLTLKEKLEIQKFVSVGTTEAITRKIRDKSDLVPHRENLTLLFSDIRGFTSLSEKLTPENVILLLNNYFENLSHIIMEAGGDIDKYVGDEIFAIFRGANKETNAVRAAIQMQKAVEKINKTRFPVEEPIAIGIGISTGWAVLGSMGSSVRMDYTAIGDTVNTGARLCDIASEDEILISPSTYDKVKEEYSAEYRGAIELKGKTAPLPVYSVSYR